MKLFFLALFLVPFLNALHAQFILNQEGEAFGTTPFFNAELIAAQHIKTIEGFYTYKKGNEAFKPSSDTFSYRFNASGQLISSLEIRQKGNVNDTLFHHYSYQADGKLSMHRFSAYGGAISEQYAYDSLQRLVSMALYRDVFDHRHDSLLSTFKMRTETLRYHKGNGGNYTRYNNYQKPYLEVSLEHDNNQFLKRSIAYYRISQHTETTLYTYNQDGLLASKACFIDSAQVAKEEWRYRYDQWGNLIEMHQYVHGVFQKDFQIVFDYKSGFLGSIIQKENATDHMSILRFTNYTYFSRP